MLLAKVLQPGNIILVDDGGKEKLPIWLTGIYLSIHKSILSIYLLNIQSLLFILLVNGKSTPTTWTSWYDGSKKEPYLPRYRLELLSRKQLFGGGDKSSILSKWRDRFFFAVGKDLVLFTIGNTMITTIAVMIASDGDDYGVIECLNGLSINWFVPVIIIRSLKISSANIIEIASQHPILSDRRGEQLRDT